MHVYGYDTLQLSYRGAAADGGDATISHEHDDARWVRAGDMQALLTDEAIDAIGQGEARVVALLRHIRTDLERYLARTALS